MKTPKQKAKELTNKIDLANKCLNYDRAKTIALICVKEILKSYVTKDLIYPKEVKYWNEVEQEITQL
jgi:hypothetical protein